MSGDLLTRFRQLEEINFPSGLHGKIMRKLVFLQFRTPFLIVTGFLFLNLLLSGWHILEAIKFNQSWELLKIMLADFEWSGEFFANFWAMLREFFPLGLMFGFVFNFGLMFYLFALMKSFRKFSKQTIN